MLLAESSLSMHGAGPACLFIYSQHGPWLLNDGNLGMPVEEKLLGGRGGLGYRTRSGEHPSDTQLSPGSGFLQGPVCSSCGPDGIYAWENIKHLTTARLVSQPSLSPNATSLLLSCTQPPPSPRPHIPEGCTEPATLRSFPRSFRAALLEFPRALFSSARLLLWS